MIPIKLTIQGLYSYQEKQTIDFTRLTAANLFGIFGPVGSGKSSVLEAITFAIYGRTDRLNLSGDNRYYNMMNLRSSEMLIDFIFETGKDNATYRATVKSSRNSRNFDDVRTPERAAYYQDKGDWTPIALEGLEQAVGLSYDNFKRTIIIPQGQFQEFLQLGNRDRTRMMKELFNLEKYEFYYKVVSLEKKNDRQLQMVQGKLQQLGTIDPEQIKAYELQLSELNKRIEELNNTLQKDQRREEEQRKLQEMTRKREETHKDLEHMQGQEPAFSSLQQKVTRYEQGVVGFKHLLEALSGVEKKIAQRERVIQGDQEKVRDQTKEIERYEQLLKTLKPAYEKKETLKKKAEELDQLLVIKSIEEQMMHEEARHSKGIRIWEQTIGEQENLKKENRQQEEAIRALRDKMPDLALLSTIRSWHMEHKNLQRQLHEQDEEIEKLARQQEALNIEKEKLRLDPLFAGMPTVVEFEQWLHRLEEEKEVIRKEQRHLGEHEGHLRVRGRLKEYAEALEENKPCPLCGSVHHPERYIAEDIEEELEKIMMRRQSLDKQIDHILRLEKDLSVIATRQREVALQKEERETKRKGQMEQVAQHGRLFIWSDYREEKDLDKAFAVAKEMDEQLKAAEKALQSSSKRLEEKERDKERFQNELQKIKTSLTVHQTQLITMQQQLTLVQPGAYQHTKPDAIEEEKKQFLDEYVYLEKAYQEYTEKLQDHRVQKDRIEGVLETNRKELKQEKQDSRALKEQIEEQLLKSPFAKLEEVLQLIAEPFDTEAEKKKIAQFNEHLAQVRSSLTQLEKEIGERVYDADAHQALVNSIKTIKDEIEQKNREQGKVDELLKKLKSDIETHAQLQETLAKQEERAENIRTMKSLFKASGFVNYISSVYLQNLCNAANDRFFQLTRQQLSLEITEDNNFQVRDFLNGGKVRSVKTLSGGQTFQASLSLALALADNIQQITHSSQNFFFLDEGFGSLDRESLNIVFDTLKSLRKENRIVGVISHVEEMQQEIDAHLQVENDPDRGTLIHRSWEA